MASIVFVAGRAAHPDGLPGQDTPSIRESNQEFVANLKLGIAETRVQPTYRDRGIAKVEKLPNSTIKQITIPQPQAEPARQSFAGQSQLQSSIEISLFPPRMGTQQ